MLLTRLAALAASVLAVVVLLDAWRIASTVRDQPLKLEVAGLEPGDQFGASVALDGDWLAVGAPGDDDASKDAGAVYTFRRAGLRWTPAGTLRAGGAQSTYELGRVIALSAQRLAISAFEPGVDAQRGVVFVFAAPTQSSESWKGESVLTSPGAAADDSFGCALALDGDTLLVGASGDRESAKLGGSVYVFERHDGAWTRAAKLLASAGLDAAQFGAAVAVSGSTAVVGAPGDGEGGRMAGAAFVFERDATGAWREVATLATNAGESTRGLGTAVALDGDVALVGARDPGAVFVFERQVAGHPWSESARLVLGSGGTGLGIGAALALRGERVLVGAAGDSDHGDASGAALVFIAAAGAPRVWSGLRKLTAPDAGAGARFAEALAQSRRTAVIGAPGSARQSGAAYVLEFAGRAARGE